MEDNKMSSGLWEEALPHALNSIRSLVNSATGMTPHDRLFKFTRNTSSYSQNRMPDWINKPGPILLKNFTRSSKNDPLVQEVELLDSNPHYAWIQHDDGRQQTISTRHLARKPRGRSVFGKTNTSSDVFDYYVAH